MFFILEGEVGFSHYYTTSVLNIFFRTVFIFIYCKTIKKQPRKMNFNTTRYDPSVGRN